MNQTDRLLEQQAIAHQAHKESEWRLSFLRTTAAEPVKKPTDEEIFKWYQQHNPSYLMRAWN